MTDFLSMFHSHTDECDRPERARAGSGYRHRATVVAPERFGALMTGTVGRACGRDAGGPLGAGWGCGGGKGFGIGGGVTAI